MKSRLGTVDELGHARRRDGAYACGVHEDVAAGRFLETRTVESWLELMHLRERVSNANEMLIDRVRHLLAEAPRITLRVSPERPHRTWRTQNGGSRCGQVGTAQDLVPGERFCPVYVDTAQSWGSRRTSGLRWQILRQLKPSNMLVCLLVGIFSPNLF
jgi:hypothetical protein